MIMRSALVILASVILPACNLPAPGKTSQPVSPTVKNSALSHADILPGNDSGKTTAKTSYFDSISNVVVDTGTLQGKREKIRNEFIVANGWPVPVDDTLFDLTFDGRKDYVIRHYGRAGTGIKNAADVYFYNSRCHCYILDQRLSDLPNPTFYISQKKITGFYLGYGGGSGARLEWIKNKWTITKEFEVDGEGDTTKWKITYPLKKKTEIKVQPYQMIPPDNILETDIQY